MSSPTPILALDVHDLGAAVDLLQRVGSEVLWVKVGVQLFISGGPDAVRELRAGGYRVFLDLKLHDIPHTVARAVESAAALGVEMVTVHASGGSAMLDAARRAAGERGPALFAVTALTSLSPEALGVVFGRPIPSMADEGVRLARIAWESGMAGVVTSVHEAAHIRREIGAGLRILTPGIRLSGDHPGDQTRVASPAAAAGAAVDFVVIGRTVTAAADPSDAFARVCAELSGASAIPGAA
ncbi:MAG: orotidine-5'-phosphate decarboxylase [Gemmatimonadota bacterium]|nr:orotidine-5'-phosphate decarboxylase [Gemmatimonadota bacterium]